MNNSKTNKAVKNIDYVSWVDPEKEYPITYKLMFGEQLRLSYPQMCKGSDLVAGQIDLLYKHGYLSPPEKTVKSNEHSYLGCALIPNSIIDVAKSIDVEPELLRLVAEQNTNAEAECKTKKYVHSIDPEKFYWSKSLGAMVSGKDLTASDIDSLYHEDNLESSNLFATYGLSDEEIDEALLRVAQHKNAHESLQKLYKLAEKETGMTSSERYAAMVLQRKKGQ